MLNEHTVEFSVEEEYGHVFWGVEKRNFDPKKMVMPKDGDTVVIHFGGDIMAHVKEIYLNGELWR